MFRMAVSYINHDSSESPENKPEDTSTGINTMVSNNCLSQEDIICQELVRQAHWAFNLEMAFAVISASITLVGFILFLTGHTSEGTYIAAGGLTPTAVGNSCIQ